MRAHAVHVVGSTGSGHTSEVSAVVTAIGAATTAEETGRSWRTTDDHHVRVGRFDGVVGRSQHVGDVRLRVDLTSRPLEVDVHFVPDFNGVGAECGHATEELNVLFEGDAVRVGRTRNAEQHFEAIGVGLIDATLHIGRVAAGPPFMLEFHPVHARVLHQLRIGEGMGLSAQLEASVGDWRSRDGRGRCGRSRRFCGIVATGVARVATVTATARCCRSRNGRCGDYFEAVDIETRVDGNQRAKNPRFGAVR